MKNVFKFVLLLAFAVSAFAWTGCSKDDKKSGGGSSSIIGTWETSDGSGNVAKIEFKEGKQVISYIYKNGILSSADKGEFSYTATELTIEWSSEWDVDHHDANNNRFPDADEFVTTASEENKVSYIVSGNKLTIKVPGTDEGVDYTRTTSPKPETNTGDPVLTGPIIGTWEIKDQYGTEIYEFLNNGQYIIYDCDTTDKIINASKGEFSYNSLTMTTKIQQRWNYSRDDDNEDGYPNLSEFKNLSEGAVALPVTFKYKLTNSNNSLELDDQEGTKFTLKRVVK